MGILDVYDGVEMRPRANQPHATIRHILSAQLGLAVTNKRWLINTEEPVELDRNSKTPDVVIFDGKNKQKLTPVLIIEITEQKMVKNVIQECIDEYKAKFPWAEIFVLNYSTKEWHSIHENEYDQDYSKLFNVKLDSLINWEYVQKVKKYYEGLMAME